MTFSARALASDILERGFFGTACFGAIVLTGFFAALVTVFFAIVFFATVFFAVVFFGTVFFTVFGLLTRRSRTGVDAGRVAR
jgi:hypothetical protein